MRGSDSLCRAGELTVLLVAYTRLSLGYLVEHHALLGGDPHIGFAVTRARDDNAAGLDAAIDRLGLWRVPYCAAVRMPWDMALFASHGSEIFFERAACRVHIQHGLGAGKLVDGQDFIYGPRWSLWDGTPNTTRCWKPTTPSAPGRLPHARHWQGGFW
jgi:hypothetical protein